MKVKLLESFTVNSERIVAKGTELEAVNGWCTFDGWTYLCELEDGVQVEIPDKIAEIADYSPYINWEERRYSLVQSITQGIYSNPNYMSAIMDAVKETKINIAEYIAYKAIEQADVIIKELKKNKV